MNTIKTIVRITAINCLNIPFQFYGLEESAVIEHIYKVNCPISRLSYTKFSNRKSTHTYLDATLYSRDTW